MGPDNRILAKYDHQVPRYTSYPPATRFAPPDDRFSYSEWLEDVNGDISLYIHIPFCAKLCYYCGCSMRVVNDYQPVKDYLGLLKSEMVLISNYLSKDNQVSHIHFGGGSPSLIKPADFQDIMAFIRSAFPIKSDAEISVEGDPRNMSEAKIAAYAVSGVTRVSIGVQDFDEDVLESINRPQPFHMTYQTVSLCREYGLNNINFDLIYGLPGQTAEKIRHTVDLVVLFKPSRISYFGYAHVPWMKKHMNLLSQETMPGPEERYELQQEGQLMLLQAGYQQIGIDHFVRSDDSMAAAFKNHTLHRNFQGYTTDGAPNLIGIGASSIGEFKKGYHQNEADIRLYRKHIEAGYIPTSRILHFKESDLPVKAVIEELMCYLSVDLEEICRKFSMPFDSFDQYVSKLGELQKDGVLRVYDRLIVIEPEYRVLARVVCEIFDQYSIEDLSLNRHAKAI